MGRVLLATALMVACGRSHGDTDGDAAVDATPPAPDFGPLPDYGPPPEPCPEPITLTAVSGPEGPYPEDAYVTVYPVDYGGWGVGLASLDLAFSVTGDPETEFARAQFHFSDESEEPEGVWTDLATEEHFEASLELDEPELGVTLEPMGTLRARLLVPELAIELTVTAPWCALSVYI